MAARAIRERLAQDLGCWLTDGIISASTHELLRERYGARAFGLGQVMKYLGISGGLLVFFGLLGFVAASVNSPGVSVFLLLTVGAGLIAAGIRLSRDRRARYGVSSGIVLGLGLVAAALGIGVAANLLGFEDKSLVLVTGLVVLPVMGLLAYGFGNIFVLILGLLGLFHWIGSWTTMFGRSSYALEIQDPRLMSAAAVLVIGVGIHHELRLRDRTGRFFQAYQTVALVYLNLSLLILSVDGWGPSHQAVLWIVVFMLAAVAQIVLGARLHNGLLTGFGITAFAINVYTRWFEHFWDRLHAGVFFLLGGLVLFGAGMGCEMLLKRMRKETA